MVMVKTIWFSVSRRSDTAGMPERWIFARESVRLLRKFPRLVCRFLGIFRDSSVSI